MYSGSMTAEEMQDAAASLTEQKANELERLDAQSASGLRGSLGILVSFVTNTAALELRDLATQIRAIRGVVQDEFDELRATQAAAVVLSLCKDHRANYAEVLKALYLTDCRVWTEVGFSTTRSNRERVERNERMVPHAWDRFMRTEGEDLVLLADPSDTELCDYDVETLTEVWCFLHPPPQDGSCP